MSSGDEQSDEETVSLFRPFTRESLAAIEARIAEQAARKAERDRLKAEGEIGPDGVPEHYSIPHHEDRMEPDPALEVGMPLPRQLAPDFPPELIATPIEDLDKYYENERVSTTLFIPRFEKFHLDHMQPFAMEKTTRPSFGPRGNCAQPKNSLQISPYRIHCKVYHIKHIAQKLRLCFIFRSFDHPFRTITAYGSDYI